MVGRVGHSPNPLTTLEIPSPRLFRPVVEWTVSSGSVEPDGRSELGTTKRWVREGRGRRGECGTVSEDGSWGPTEETTTGTDRRVPPR